MKSLPRKICILVLMGIILNVFLPLYYLYNNYEDNKDIRLQNHFIDKMILSIKKLESADIVIIGDSKSLVGLDSYYLSQELSKVCGRNINVINLSLWATHPKVLYKIFYPIFQFLNLSEPKFIIYNISYLNLLKGNSTQSFGLNTFFAKLKSLNVNLLKKLTQKITTLKFQGYDVDLSSFAFGDIGIRTKSKLNHNELSGEEFPLSLQEQRKEFLEKSVLMPHQETFHYVVKLLNLFQNSTKAVIILPATPLYNKLVSKDSNENYLSFLNQIQQLQKLDVSFWNLINEKVPLRFFYNSDHITSDGRTFYTSSLKEKIIQSWCKK